MSLLSHMSYASFFFVNHSLEFILIFSYILS